MQIACMVFLVLLTQNSQSIGVTLYKQLKEPVADEIDTPASINSARQPRKTLTVLSADTYKSSSQYAPSTKPTNYVFPMQLSTQYPSSTAAKHAVVAPPHPTPKEIIQPASPELNEMVLVPKSEYEKYREMTRKNPNLTNSVDNGGGFDKVFNLINSGINHAGNFGIGMLNTSNEIVGNGLTMQQDLMSKMASTETQNYEVLMKNQLAMQEMTKKVRDKRNEMESKTGGSDSNKSYFKSTYASGFLKRNLI